MLEPTGFCWYCGYWIKGFIEGVSKDLFCNDKHKQQYERAQDRQIKKGKRAGYGLAGSTH